MRQGPAYCNRAEQIALAPVRKFGYHPRPGARHEEVDAVRNCAFCVFGNRVICPKYGFGSTRYDFILKWTPDPSQSQFGPSPNVPAAPDADAPPDLFTAFQQQLGLKLESTKAPVDVLVIDRVEKPSAN